ncbi:MAG: DUF4261 domain-containing protein [Arcanobacterium sp.]|nr:DUF4261 domain-containing protein [Arcanobacterium sp.]MDY5589080.1 DUF4261 domain-containing protein [Arcanobacterium sp.]
MQQLGVSAIHPLAPEFLSAAALFSAPIDLERAIGRLNSLWKVGAVPEWATAPDGPHAPHRDGRIMHFELNGTQVLLSAVPEQLTPPKGTLPEHSDYVAITLYTPATPAQEKQSSDHEAQEIPTNHAAVARRRAAVTAHIILTQLADALMHEPGAVGVFRSELGVVQPPEMIHELAPLLTQGQVPLPLWVNIRLQNPDLTVGRTLGMPLFGHLDLEVLESTHPAEAVYAELANIATYIITGDAYLLPGQSVGSSEGERIAITQELSPLDSTPVIRIMY